MAWPPFLTDVRSAARALRRAPGFTCMALGSLGLGMALCATTVAVVDAYLWRGLPYPHADRLYWLQVGPPGEAPPRDLDTRDWSSVADVVEHAISWDLDMFYLLGRDRTEQARGAWVSPGFLDAFGIRPVLGRGFEASAFLDGSPNVALISDALWRRRFGADPDVIGQPFTAYVSDRPDEAEQFVVVGVLPADAWHFNPFTDVLVPLRAPSQPYLVQLRRGVDTALATTRLAAVVNDARDPALPVGLESAHRRYTTATRPVLRAALVAAALALLVACANVAALLLVRATGRDRELAVRRAVGASPLAIARVLVSEAALLAGGATLLATVLTGVAVTAFGEALQVQIGRAVPGGEFAFTPRMAAIVLGTGLLTALTCALAPLGLVWRHRLSTGLTSAGRAMTASAASGRLRTSLIAGEIAVAFALLSGATLMVRTILSLTSVEFGTASEGVSTTGLALRQGRYPTATERADALARVLTSLRAQSPTGAVALTAASLVQQPQALDVRDDGAAGGATRAAMHRVSDGYFAALDIALLAGRPIEADDRIGRQDVAVVSATLARRLWPGRSAVGSLMVMEEDGPDGEPRLVPRRVVGVAADVRQGATDDERADVYVALLQSPGRFASAIVRTPSGPLDARTIPLRVIDAARTVDPEIAVSDTQWLDALRGAELAAPRFMTHLLTLLAASSTLLAVVGVYGLVAYGVRQREREVAIRMAIGAEPRRITRLFLSQGVRLVVAGVASGGVASIGTNRLLASQLAGVTPDDMPTRIMCGLTLAVAALLAVWWPARRAAGGDPAVALRAD